MYTINEYVKKFGDPTINQVSRDMFYSIKYKSNIENLPIYSKSKNLGDSIRFSDITTGGFSYNSYYGCYTNNNFGNIYYISSQRENQKNIQERSFDFYNMPCYEE